EVVEASVGAGLAALVRDERLREVDESSEAGGLGASREVVEALPSVGVEGARPHGAELGEGRVAGGAALVALGVLAPPELLLGRAHVLVVDRLVGALRGDLGDESLGAGVVLRGVGLGLDLREVERAYAREDL